MEVPDEPLEPDDPELALDEPLVLEFDELVSAFGAAGALSDFEAELPSDFESLFFGEDE